MSGRSRFLVGLEFHPSVEGTDPERKWGTTMSRGSRLGPKGLFLLFLVTFLAMPIPQTADAKRMGAREHRGAVDCPDEPVSVSVENEPNVSVTNTVATDAFITNDQDHPVSVAMSETVFETSAFISFDEDEHLRTRDFIPQPPTDKIFVIRYLNVALNDAGGAGIQYSIGLGLGAGTNTIWFRPEGTVLLDTHAGLGIAHMSEPVWVFHDPEEGNLQLTAVRDAAKGEEPATIRATVFGVLIDP